MSPREVISPTTDADLPRHGPTFSRGTGLRFWYLTAALLLIGAATLPVAAVETGSATNPSAVLGPFFISGPAARSAGPDAAFTGPQPLGLPRPNARGPAALEGRRLGTVPGPAGLHAPTSTLVINEIDYIQPGVDNAEFVELFNGGTEPVNLGFYNVLGIDGSGAIYRRDVLPNELLLPGEYFVLGSAEAENVNLVVGSVDIWRDGESGQRPENAVALVESPQSDPQQDVLVDSVSYDGDTLGGPPTGGAWTELEGVEPGDNSNQDRLGISRFPNAQDRNENNRDLSPRCITPGYANTSDQGATAPCQPPATVTPAPTPDLGPAGLIINEIDVVQPGTTPQDFVEILNIGTTIIDLSDYYLLAIDAASGLPVEYRRDKLPTVRLGPGERLVVGNSGVPNLGLDLGRQDLYRTNLGDGSLAIALVYNTVGRPEADQLVDTVSYEGSTPGGPQLGGKWTEVAGLGFDPENGENVGFSRSPDGSDSDHNRRDFALRCITPGGPTSPLTGNCSGETATPTPSPTGTRATATVTATATARITETPTPSRTPAPNEFIVTVPDDDDDAQPGDGLCDDGAGRCTLRAALQEVAMATGPFTIRFIGPMEIDVRASRPLPPVRRDRLTITAVEHHRGGEPGVTLSGSGGVPGLQIEAPNVSLHALAITGFRHGVVAGDTATGLLMGSDDDGFIDEREGVVIAQSTLDGVVITEPAEDVTLRRNRIERSGRHGVLLWSTRGTGNTLSRNDISNNGGGAIAVLPLAPDMPVPVIDRADPNTRMVAGTACPSCRIEVFADGADEAAVFLGTVQVPLSGAWQLTGVDLSFVANVTASATTPDGTTSRLSAAQAAGEPWRLVSVATEMPRLLDIRGALDRVWRVLDPEGQPVNNATLVLAPESTTLTSDENGEVQLRRTWRERLNPGERLGLSIAGLRVGIDTQPLNWYPALLLGRSVPESEGARLELDDLDPRGLGLSFVGRPARWSSTTGLLAPETGGLWVDSRLLRQSTRLAVSGGLGAPYGPVGLHQPGAEIFGAGMTAAPGANQGGPYGWQHNMARGGGLYELNAGPQGAAGELRIVAPVAAFNTTGNAGACPGMGGGSVITGWSCDTTCWLPVEGSIATAPDPGAETFEVAADMELASPASSDVGATGAYTMVTAGFDATPPVITMTVTALDPDGRLPEVIAEAADRHSGVNRTTVEVTLAGERLGAEYDPLRRVIALPESSRSVPPGFLGGELRVTLSDGFCNSAEAGVQIGPPDALQFRILAPYTSTP